MADDVNEINQDLTDQGAEITSIEAVVATAVQQLAAESVTIGQLQAQLAALPPIQTEEAAKLHQQLTDSNGRLQAILAALQGALPTPPAPSVIPSV